MTAISRRAVAASLVALLGTGLTACTQSPGSGSSGGTSAAPSASSSSSASSALSPSSADEQEGTSIRIRIGDPDADRDRAGQPAGRAQLEQLPLTLSFEDLNGEEKIGHLDHELTMDGMPKGDDSQVGDLGYYAPWGNVVLY